MWRFVNMSVCCCYYDYRCC